MTSRDDIIRKIAALQERTIDQGCSEAEALSAAQIVVKLLAQHGLAMSDIEIRESNCDHGIIETFDHSSHEINFCITSIGRFCNCKCWRSKEALSGIQYNFFGFPEDVRTAKWLYEIILVAMNTELVGFRLYLKHEKQRAGKKQISSFLSGMAGRVGCRLVEMKREQDAETKETTGRDLVLVKDDVVRKQFDALGIDLYHQRAAGRNFDKAAHASGDRAGGRVNFNQSLTDGPKRLT